MGMSRECENEEGAQGGEPRVEKDGHGSDQTLRRGETAKVDRGKLGAYFPQTLYAVPWGRMGRRWGARGGLGRRGTRSPFL